jgi:DNA repair exonuclease SbcCD nuclease subunit
MLATLLGHNSRADSGIDEDILKLIFYTDPHLSSTSLRSRIDDYPTNSLNKISFVLNHAKNINANAILCGGDYFHSSHQYLYLRGKQV